jgi:hypothetical protein
MGPSGQGYISDYYLNNTKKRGPYENNAGGMGSGAEEFSQDGG